MKVWDATPITPESLARDDALSLIRFLLERVTSEAELRDRIAGDKAISTETRAAALKLAEGFWATRIRRQAESLVSPLFDRLLVRAEVLDSVRADPTSAWDLNNSAWALVKRPNRPEADSRRGLRLAERACQLEPNNGAYLNTLGVAKYRMGQYEKSQATLTQSNRLNGNRGPADLAFLAMTQHRLHQVEAARATFQRLREVMKDPRIAANAENQGFLREVESAIPNSPEQPKDVLAPQRY
jgi:tetratricopeptide (TPR) repeat protein